MLLPNAGRKKDVVDDQLGTRRQEFGVRALALTATVIRTSCWAMIGTFILMCLGSAAIPGSAGVPKSWFYLLKLAFGGSTCLVFAGMILHWAIVLFCFMKVSLKTLILLVVILNVVLTCI